MHRSRSRRGFFAAVAVAIGTVLILPAGAMAVPNQWSPVGNSGNTPAINSPGQSVNALLATSGGVLIGGNFFNPGGAGTADSFALWDGSTFTGIGNNGGGNGYFDTNGDTVRAIATDGDDIYVGGSFTDNSGNANADNIVMWDDSASAWLALGSGLNAAVNAIAVDGGVIYAGGDFTDAGGVLEADYVAKWNGSTWSALGDDGAGQGALNGHVNALAMKNGNLFAGGLFTDAESVDAADYIAKWNGSQWSSLGSINPSPHGVLTGEVYAILIDGSNTWVGGNFTNANNGNADMDYVARWRNSSWSDLNTGGVITNVVYSLAKDGSDLYVGGLFTESGGPRDRIAKWDGSSWSNLDDNGGNGAIGNNSVLSLAIWEGDLYVSGTFVDVMGETESDYLVSWGLPPDVQPDGRIRNGQAGAWTGNNIYNTTGQNQKKQQSGGRNALRAYQLSIQNDSPTEDDVFTLDASAGSVARYTITYFDGALDVTAAIVGGTYVTPLLAPGAHHVIDIEVQYNNAAAGSKVTRTVTITSNADTSKQDAVKFVAKR